MIETTAKAFAIKAHKGQTYGTKDYSFHLGALASVAKEFKLNENIIAACWLHDTIEDGKVSFQDIKEVCGEEVAEMVYCVTDELGRNRTERKLKTYPKIKANNSTFCVKLCDRIANMQQSFLDNNEQLGSMYLKEHPKFKNQLFSDNSTETLFMLWKRLEDLVSNETKKRQSV
ncbi:MAG: bifunctional (p)ppGpp synthetase/guanosine-3',5'-bis(diphosphate) 3'-pyrophosphohydrolase [Cytophagaceae bacterium]|nr:bifunctional (p)ppGpp synthetase/guanosine-3',5'-bis(diphosphate) 3'-pyrophosphohydrolase [Cytophagaceae bacterium]